MLDKSAACCESPPLYNNANLQQQLSETTGHHASCTEVPTSARVGTIATGCCMQLQHPPALRMIVYSAVNSARLHAVSANICNAACSCWRVMPLPACGLHRPRRYSAAPERPDRHLKHISSSGCRPKRLAPELNTHLHFYILKPYQYYSHSGATSYAQRLSPSCSKANKRPYRASKSVQLAPVGCQLLATTFCLATKTIDLRCHPINRPHMRRLYTDEPHPRTIPASAC
jgi:hypothetical protein